MLIFFLIGPIFASASIDAKEAVASSPWVQQIVISSDLSQGMDIDDALKVLQIEKSVPVPYVGGSGSGYLSIDSPRLPGYVIYLDIRPIQQTVVDWSFHPRVVPPRPLPELAQSVK